MRILLVTEDLPVANLGGAGRHAVLLGNTLIAAGHSVEMLGRVRATGADGNNDFLGPLHCGIDTRGTGWQEHRFGAFLPLRREHAARRVWQAIVALGPARFDLIHYHGHQYALGALVPAGVPFVQTVHDQGTECLMLTRFRRGEPCTATDARECAGCATPRPNALQRALSAAAVRRHRRVSARAFARHPVVFVSDFLRRRYEHHARPAVPIRAAVVHNFTNLRGMADLSPPPAAGGRPVALMVGRIDAAKGFGALLARLPDAALQHWRIRVVGDGPERAALQAQHAARGVEFTGSLSLAEVYRETLQAAVCVVPSVWEEPCGTTVLEGLALGRPVAALARGGTPELARYQQHSGQLMLHPDIDALAAWLAGGPPPPAAAAEPADSPDVMQRLPALLAVYAQATRAA